MRSIEGLVSLRCRCGAAESVGRALAAIIARGSEVFATIDHVAAAERSGLAMPAATVIAFGSPRAGTPLMRSAPTLAIDLPLRLLIGDDEDGVTWASYDEPERLARRHGLPPAAAPSLRAMAGPAHGSAPPAATRRARRQAFSIEARAPATTGSSAALASPSRDLSMIPTALETTCR